MILIFLIQRVQACQFGFTLNQSTNEVIIDTLQPLPFTAFGIWTRYYTYYQDKTTQIKNPQIDAQIFRGFDQQGQTNINYRMSILGYHLSINLQNEGEVAYQDFERPNHPDQVEGVWIFTYIGFDQSIDMIQTFLVNSKTDQIQENQIVGGRASRIDQVVIFEEFNEQQERQNIFSGYIAFTQSQDQQVKFTTGEQLLEYLKSCPPEKSCNQYSVNRLISGIIDTFDKYYQYTQIDNFWIDGWFLFTPLPTTVTYNNLILKIIQYNKESFYYSGMFPLLIRLNFDQKNLENNKIIAQTYDYTYAIWFDIQYLQVDGEISYQIEQIQSWVYFRYLQYDQSDSRAEFYVSFSNSDDVNVNMGDYMYLFRYGQFYIYLGFSQLYPNKFLGQMANVNIQSCLSSYPQAKRGISHFQQKACHYSCLTCSGPMDNHCLSCYDQTQTNRIFNALQNTCECKMGYLAAEGELQCVDIQTVFKQSTFLQLENELFDDQPCKDGQFQYQIGTLIRCYDCPQQSSLGRQCADCLENLYTWQNDMKCSFDYYQPDNKEQNTFIKYIRPQSKIDYYYIQEELLLCQGCQLYEGGKQIVQDKTILYGSCNENYHYKDLKCYPCQENCQTCEDLTGLCQQCEIGYVLNNQICHSCPDYCQSCIYKNQIICSQCLSGYTAVNGICQQCGANCLYCQFDAIYQITRCLACKDTNHFQLFDGVNCQQNTIENCITEYQYYFEQISEDETFESNTLLQDYKPLLDVEIVNKCALCKSNHLNYGTYCEQQEFIKPDDQVLNVDGEIIYLISSSEEEVIDTGNCRNQCNKCVSFRYDRKCIECSSRYYANFFNGECIECPQQICLTCQQQNKYYKDGGKWNIRAYFQYIFKGIVFEYRAASLDFDDYEVICLQCPVGYMLYNHTCILNCPENCKECQIIDGQNVCIFCGSNNYGSLLTTYENQCQNCPQNCEFCQPRSQNDIYNINPLYNPDDASKYYYSYLCLKPQIDQNIHYNKILQQYVKCQDEQSCNSQINIKLKAHCDQQSYDNEKQKYTNIQDFKYENVLLSVIFSNTTSHFSNIETPQFIDYLNINQIMSLIYEITLISSSDSCLITHFTSTTVPRNVFSIVKNKLVINGNNLILKSEQAQILNFSQVEIQQAKFYLPFFIKISHPTKLIVNFRDIDYASTDQSNDIDIILVNPEQIVVHNFYIVAIEQLITSQNNMISYYYTNTSTVTSLNIQMDNLQFTQSQFINLDFLIIEADSRIQDIIINISNSVIESTFQNSSFIRESSITNYGQVILHNVTFIVQVYQASLIHLNGQLNLSASVKLSGNLTQSNFIRTIQFEIVNSQVYNTYLYNSTLIDNNIKIQDNQINDLQINNLIFNKVLYDNLSNFIRIIDNNLWDSLIIQNVQTVDCQFLVQYSSKTTQRLIMFQGFNFQLLHSHFNKSILGLTDLSIKYCETVIIDNVTVIGYNIQGLQKKLDCYNSLVNISLQNAFIQLENIQFIYLINSQFNNIMIQNYPIIGIQCYDNSLSYEIHLENVNFNNNLVLLTEFKSQVSIFQLLASQQGNFNATNVSFTENTINEYQQNQFQNSATTFLIEAKEFSIFLKNNFFNKNYLFNSSDSVLFIQSQLIIVQDSTFTKSNLYDDFILKFVIWGSNSTEEFFQENLQEIYPVQSVGGNGKFVASTLQIYNCQFSYSIASQGSGFYVTLQIRLEISNSAFIGLRNRLIQDDSQGGSIFINLIALNSTIKILNTQFSNSYSLDDGGAIYINSRQTTSEINLQQITVMNCYSLKGTFVSAYLNKYSSMIIESISIKNDIQTFRQYLSLIDNLSDNYVEQFHQSSAIFYIQLGSVYISECIISDIQFSSVIYFYSSTQLYIFNSVIQNLQFSSLGLIQLYPTSYADTITFIKNIQILNCSSLDPQQTFCNYEINNNLADFQCSNFNNKPASLKLYQKDTQAKIDCFYTKLLHFTSSSSMIYVNSLQVSDYFYLSDLQIRNNNCSFCQNGMISIKNVEIDTPEFNNIILEQLVFSNNTCGSGCIVIGQQSFITFPSRRLLQNLLFQSRFTIQSTITLEYSEFFNNTAQNGMIIVSNMSLMVFDVKFIKNNGTDISGGILFLGNENHTFNIMSSEISDSVGNKGGGLYLGNKTISGTEILQVLLSSNHATTFGQDFASSPQELTISINGGKSFIQTEFIAKTEQVIQQIVTKPYQFITLPSGQKIRSYQFYDENLTSLIPQNLTLRVIALNSLRQQIINLQNTTCTIQKRIINININSSEPFDQTGLDIKEVQFNTTSKDYNFDDLVINFDPYQSYDYVLQLQFKCSSIQIPVINSTPPYNILSYSNNYELRMNVRTFKCQRGEQYDSQNGTCILCDSSLSLYSVVVKATKCSVQDESTMSRINSTHIELRKTYWRPYDDNNIISNCYNFPSNCEGGWISGDQSCALGHIGALCEQCDLYNVRGSGQYSVSGQFQCGSCSNVDSNTLQIVLIIIWTLITIFLSVKETVENVDQLVLRSKCIKAGFISVSLERIQFAVLMKILTNYLQIISSIGTFQLNLPPGLRDLFVYTGSPIKSMAFSLDCFLVGLSNISIIYFRNLWSICMPLYYSTVIFLVYFVFIIIKDIKLDITVISTTLIYIFILVQPDIIGGFMSLLSYREICQILWVQGNVSYLYLTNEHIRWVICFVLPVLIIFGILIPLVLYLNMSKFKHKLENTYVLRLYGYLYNEYSKVAYYWEILKICQKELIIIFLTFYEDVIIIKGTLVFIVIFCYDIFSKTHQPYKSGDLNKLDSQNSFVCALSIVLGMAIYFADKNGNQEIIWTFYLIMGMTNFFFVVKMIAFILISFLYNKTEQLDQLRDLIKKKYPNIIINYPWLNKYLENSQVKSKRIKQRFIKVREYLWKKAQYIREQTKNQKLETDPTQKLEKDALIPIDGSIYSIKSRNQSVKSFQQDNGETIIIRIRAQQQNKDQFNQQDNDYGQIREFEDNQEFNQNQIREFEDNQELNLKLNKANLKKIRL